MIVQPDFLDHWKTQMLIDALNDECAPIYVIRLWIHCQNRKTHRFPMGKPEQLKAMCKASGDAQKFHDAMIECGFVRIEGDEWVAHEWDIINASLIANWKNGMLGGRPKKQPKKNPSKTHGLPVTNPHVTDKIGLDKIDKSNIPPSPQKPEDDDGYPSKPDFLSDDAWSLLISIWTTGATSSKTFDASSWAYCLRNCREFDPSDTDQREYLLATVKQTGRIRAPTQWFGRWLPQSVPAKPSAPIDPKAPIF